MASRVSISSDADVSVLMEARSPLEIALKTKQDIHR